MPDYKGVTLLEEDRLGDFPAWKRLVLAYFFKSVPVELPKAHKMWTVVANATRI